MKRNNLAAILATTVFLTAGSLSAYAAEVSVSGATDAAGAAAGSATSGAANTSGGGATVNAGTSTTGGANTGAAGANAGASGGTEIAVDASDLFGDLDVDTSVTDDAQLTASIQGLGDQSRDELDKRCSIINANQSSFDAETVKYCEAYARVKMKM